MAGIDKTYITKEQYKIARAWWIKNYHKQKKVFGHAWWLYPFSCYDEETITPQFLKEHTSDVNNFVDGNCLWNTSAIFDLWLIQNCPLDFIQERIKEQYGEDYWGFKYKDQLDFSEKPRVLSISDGEKINIYFYQDLNGEKIEKLDKIIFYGTTFMYKVIDDMCNCFSFPHNKNLIVEYMYYGLCITNRGGKNFIFEEDATETLVNIPNIYSDNVQEFFNFPKITHSYKLKECQSYPTQAIYISKENEVYDISAYKGFNKKDMSRYMLDLPKYIENKIQYK